jgi:hypothetical protein
MYAIRTCICFALSVLFMTPATLAQELAWVRDMGGTGYDFGYGIAVGATGNTYVTGIFQGTATFGTFTLTAAGGASDYDIFVEKLDSAGVVQWARRMGGASADTPIGGVAVDAIGNAYITGTFFGTATFGDYTLTALPPGYSDIFVVKLDSAGVVQWARRMGGADHDSGWGIAVDAGGNTYVTGYFKNVGNFGTFYLTASAQSQDIFVEKLDSAGVVQWARRMGGTDIDKSFGIAVDAIGNAYVTGYFSGTATFGTFTLTAAEGASHTDIFVEKLDSAGVVQWARRMGGAGAESGDGIRVDGNGNSYVTGVFQGTATFGTFTLTAAGGASDYDIYVEKLDSAGAVQWATRMGGTGTDGGFEIVVDTSGNAYVTGDFQNTATFGTFTLTSAGGQDIFVAKLLGCGSDFVEDRGYGSLLFPPFCTRNASGLTEDVYNSKSVGLFHGANDGLFLSSKGRQFSPLVVDDAVHVNGIGTGLGPYTPQPGVPPYMYDFAIERNLQPLPAHDVTSFIPSGGSRVLLERLDTQREIYGNTAVYLVRDCGIWLDKNQTGQTRLNWVSRQVQVAGAQSNLDVVSGTVLKLHADGNFSRACFLGTYNNTTQMLDTRPSPPAGDGYYYLVSGTCASPIGYGNSSLGPRTGLPPATPCP